jgi:hypothetical protein
VTERSFLITWPYSIERDRVARPLIPVVFTYERRTGPVLGLVDSGADLSVCSITIALEAGMDVAAFPVRPMRGIGGISRGRLCPMDLELFGRRVATEILVVEANLVLLGRRDVFDAFVFGFDQRAGQILIDPY